MVALRPNISSKRTRENPRAAQLQRYASMNQHRRPIWFAVLVTPWVVPLAFVTWSVFAVLFTEGTGGLKDWSVLFAFFVLVLAVTYVPMLIFGLPYVLWLRALGVLTAPLVCIGAVFAAIVAIPAFGWLTGPHIPPSGASILLSGALGLLSGLVFCVAAGITFRPSGRRTLLPRLISGKLRLPDAVREVEATA